MTLPDARRSLGHLIHAYAQAPWRAQRQWLGAVMAIGLGLAMVAALYLDITSQAAIAGRQIQDLTNQMIAVQQTSADLQSKLAQVTSTTEMQRRAIALGYEPVDADTLQYVAVPGYQQPEPAILAGAHAIKPSAALLPPEYSESLWSWLSRRIGASTNPAVGAVP